MTALVLHDDLEVRDGWYWPKADDVAFDHIRMYLPVLRWAARKAKDRALVVQAGGNAGMHPVELAKMFDRVITFEPEQLNYQCLLENIRPYPNVEAYQAVVGNSDESVSMEPTDGLKDGKRCVNTGSFVVGGKGNIRQIRIDDLDLDQCSMIQLDVEGWELNALKGAESTIKMFSPLIMVETFEHGEDPEPFLLELGYEMVLKGVYDRIYVRTHGTDDVQ